MSGESQLPTKTSNTKSEIEESTAKSGSVSTTANVPKHVDRKVDDKAAALETELVECKARFNKELFVYIFVITFLVISLIGYSAPASVFATLIVAAIILLIGLAKWLEFPWVVENLGRWLSLLEKRLSGAEQDETEPMTSPPPSNANSPLKDEMLYKMEPRSDEDRDH